jgi:hypothetical protein
LRAKFSHCKFGLKVLKRMEELEFCIDLSFDSKRLMNDIISYVRVVEMVLAFFDASHMPVFYPKYLYTFSLKEEVFQKMSEEVV